MTATAHNVPNGGDVSFPFGKFVDISVSGTGIAYGSSQDTTAKLIDLGRRFETTLFGTTVGGNKVSVANNGWFFFNDTTVNGPDIPGSSAPLLPSAALEPFAIAPFWVDLYSTTNSEIYWRIDGSGASERLIVQWNRFRFDRASTSEVTFQAQVYAYGEVVFAYKTINGIPANEPWSAGIVDGTDTGGVFLQELPRAGGTHAFFARSVPLPAQVDVPAEPFAARVEIGNDNWIDIDVTDLVLPPGDFYVSEINYNPATGKGQWFEVANLTANPIDLGGWKIDFGGDNTHVITGPLVLPAGGTLLFAQDADAAGASAGGPAIHYVYGTGFNMPNASGSISLSFAGGVYATSAWTSAGTQGYSLSFDRPNPQVRFATTGVTFATCASSAGYGTQFGTPGILARCVPWTLAPTAPNGFTPIAATGTALLSSTTLNGHDDVTVPVNFVAAGGRAVKVGGSLWGTTAQPVSVSSNGWVALGNVTSTSSSGTTNPGTSDPNGLLALFWDNLSGNVGTTANPSGVYWQQFDPDATPNSGDEYTLISWENWRRYSSSATTTSNLNFQVKILEATGDLEVHYGTMQSSSVGYWNGTDAASWLESADGTWALTIGSNDLWVKQNAGWKYTYLP